jgi:hypothetical protein
MYKRPRLLHTLAFSLLLSAGVPASADIIQIPAGKQNPELADMERPQRGQSQDAVLRQFGQPVSRQTPRGNPPITRWEYPGFVVYFEHSHVIHSVIKHRPKLDQ